jgi:hypothetical protein
VSAVGKAGSRTPPARRSSARNAARSKPVPRVKDTSSCRCSDASSALACCRRMPCTVACSRVAVAAASPPPPPPPPPPNAASSEPHTDGAEGDVEDGAGADSVTQRALSVVTQRALSVVTQRGALSVVTQRGALSVTQRGALSVVTQRGALSVTQRARRGAPVRRVDAEAAETAASAGAGPSTALSRPARSRNRTSSPASVCCAPASAA